MVRVLEEKLEVISRENYFNCWVKELDIRNKENNVIIILC